MILICYKRGDSSAERIAQNLSERNTVSLRDIAPFKLFIDDYLSYLPKFSLTDPDYLIVDDIDYSDVVFRDDFQYWQISVSANETNFENIFGWAEDYKKTLKKENLDIIEIKNVEMTIDNNKALAFEIQYKDGIDFYEQDTKRFFITKDNILYKISTRELDHQKIWDNFKFIDK